MQRKPTILALVKRLDALEAAVSGRLDRERLELPGLGVVTLNPGLTVDAVLALLEQIYGLPWHEREGSPTAIDAGRPDVTSTPTAPAGPGASEVPRLNAGQRAIQRVANAERRRYYGRRKMTAR